MVSTRRDELVRLTEAAAAVALSVVLGNIRLLELPSGGSIALATIPLLALAATRGLRTALIACSCAGAAHALAGGTIIHPAQLVLDYLVAYAVLAAAALASPTAAQATRAFAIVIAMSMHLAAMVISGVVFFAPVVGDAAWTYSLVYNAATVVPETLLALWLVPPLARAVARAQPQLAWRTGLMPPPPPQARIARLPPVGAAWTAPQPAAVPAAVVLPPLPRIVLRPAPS